MKKFMEEFKAFALRGNVMDMAVGIIIGGAFTSIVSSLVEDIITPMDISIIGCVVNGPGEALVSTLGVTGGNKKSGLYEDGVRKDRLDNDDMISQLETRIRAKATILDAANRIDVQQVEK